jgi:hypothetical protein
MARYDTVQNQWIVYSSLSCALGQRHACCRCCREIRRDRPSLKYYFTRKQSMTVPTATAIILYVIVFVVGMSVGRAYRSIRVPVKAWREEVW